MAWPWMTGSEKMFSLSYSNFLLGTLDMEVSLRTPTLQQKDVKLRLSGFLCLLEFV